MAFNAYADHHFFKIARLQPFTVTFYTDDFEPDDTDGTGGFKLDWEQVSCQSDTVRESLWHTAYVNVNAK